MKDCVGDEEGDWDHEEVKHQTYPFSILRKINKADSGTCLNCQVKKEASGDYAGEDIDEDCKGDR